MDENRVEFHAIDNLLCILIETNLTIIYDDCLADYENEEIIQRSGAFVRNLTERSICFHFSIVAGRTERDNQVKTLNEKANCVLRLLLAKRDDKFRTCTGSPPC